MTDDNTLKVSTDNARLVSSDMDAIEWAFKYPGTVYRSLESGDLFEHEAHGAPDTCRCGQGEQ